MGDYPALRHFSLPEDVEYYHKNEKPSLLHLEDEAVLAVIDFHEDNPPIITPSQHLETALDKIKGSGLPILLVISDEDHIIGALSSKDLLGNRPLEASKEHDLPHTELEVSHIMTPLNQIQVMLEGSLANAKVGHLITTLNECHADYLLVSDGEHEAELGQITGFISRSILSRQLHTDLTDTLTAQGSISELHNLRGT